MVQIIENLPRLTIKSLKGWGYLSTTKTGNIEWQHTGDKINVASNPKDLLLTIWYNYDGKPLKYSIAIKLLPIRLTNSTRPYLVCPVSGKWALKLYLCDGLFMHHTEVSNRGIHYHNQTQSKRNRQIAAHHENKKKVATFYANPKAKCFYNDGFTKKYKSIKRTDERSERQMDYFLATCKLFKGRF